MVIVIVVVVIVVALIIGAHRLVDKVNAEIDHINGKAD
jgi:hypothetical protein